MRIKYQLLVINLNIIIYTEYKEVAFHQQQINIHKEITVSGYLYKEGKITNDSQIFHSTHYLEILNSSFDEKENIILSCNKNTKSIFLESHKHIIKLMNKNNVFSFVGRQKHFPYLSKTFSVSHQNVIEDIFNYIKIDKYFNIRQLLTNHINDYNFFFLENPSIKILFCMDKNNAILFIILYNEDNFTIFTNIKIKYKY